MNDRPQLLTIDDLPQLAQAITILENDAVLLRHEGDNTTAEHLSISAGRLQFIYRLLSQATPKRKMETDRQPAVRSASPPLDTTPGKPGRYHATGYGREDAPEHEQSEPQHQRDPQPSPSEQRQDRPKRDDRQEQPKRKDKPKRDDRNLPPLPHPPKDRDGDVPQFYDVPLVELP